jgi:hypothetical protein
MESRRSLLAGQRGDVFGAGLPGPLRIGLDIKVFRVLQNKLKAISYQPKAERTTIL